MLCVYADSSLTDVKAVRPVSAEFAFGSDENDFQAVFNDDQERLAAHCYLCLLYTSYAKDEGSSGYGLNHPYDFPHDYGTSPMTEASITNASLSPSNALIRFYGRCV